MGNAQSNGTGNQNQHKLSKPKTNTNSPIGTPKNASPVSVYSKYADLSFARKQHPKTQSRFPLQNEFDAGFSYNGDDGIGELASQVQVHLSMSRSNSVASQNGRNSIARVSALPGSETALPPQPLGVDMNTTLKILQEVRKNTSPDDLAALRKFVHFRQIQDLIPPFTITLLTSRLRSSSTAFCSFRASTDS